MAKLGVIKNFLKFKHDMQFGVIGCAKSNISYLPNKKGEIGNLCMVGFAEDVIIWDIQTQQILHRIHGRDQDNVTFITYFKDQVNDVTISIGYSSGFVAIYSLWDFTKIFSDKIHRHPITSIIYCEPFGNRIICGSMDTDISVVDIEESKGYHLKGHMSPITKLQYISSRDILISSSQDGNIKFWFLGQSHCFKTIANSSDIWDFVFINDTNILVSGGSDTVLMMWQLTFLDQSTNDFDLHEIVTDRMSNIVKATSLGSLGRTSYKRVLEMKIDESQTYIAINTGEKKVEVFKVLTKEEVAKRLRKKTKKAHLLNQNTGSVILSAENMLKKSCEILFPDKCKTISIIFKSKKTTLEILTSMKNNAVAVMNVNLATCKMEVASHLTRHGHRSAIVYSQFLSDAQKLLTVSLSEAKLWNKSDFQCYYSINWPRRRLLDGDDKDDEYVQAELAVAPGKKLDANTAVLLPGDRHVVVGYKSGVMILYNVITGEALQWMDAHDEAVTSLVMTADKTRVLSASTDKTVKVWRIEYGVMNSGAKGRLQLVDSGVCQKYLHGVTKLAVTPDNKTIIVSFLNNKAQSSFVDNLDKKVLDFYQHSQPVTCIDVKHDNSEIVTGSGDKTVIKWSLQFADCKIFKGHREGVTDVRYLPGRSQALSCDRSGVIIHIDLVNMKEIQRLMGHGAQVTSLSVVGGAGGVYDDEEEMEGDCEVASVSVDGSVRLWYESEEILSREMEEEARRDRQYEEEELAREEPLLVGARQDRDTGLLTRKTLKTEHAADELIEALDTYENKVEADPRMVAAGHTRADLYVLHVLNRVRSGDLEFALAQLPMKYVEALFEVGAHFLGRGLDCDLLVRVLCFLGQVHFKTVVSRERLKPLLSAVAVHATQAAHNHKRLTGMCLEALLSLDDLAGPIVATHNEAKTTKNKRKKTDKN